MGSYQSYSHWYLSHINVARNEVVRAQGKATVHDHYCSLLSFFTNDFTDSFECPSTHAGMALFLRNVSFHGILLDALFEEGNREWVEVSQLLREGIQEGTVQPLRTTIFQRSEVEDAFRYMAQGKHIGKVLLQVGHKFILPLRFLLV